MDNHFSKVKHYLYDLDYTILKEDQHDNLFVIEKEEAGIKNMVIVLAYPILIAEQHLIDLKKEDVSIYKQLLQKNREIVHGAFALDETGKSIIFRDTLQLENLDLNELEGTLNSLSLLLSEYYTDLIAFSK